MRILIVDDEKNIRRALALALESMAHEVVCASNSALALAELRGKSFDVVLLDLRLSQESGLDVLEEILRINPQAAVGMRFHQAPCVRLCALSISFMPATGLQGASST